MSLRDFLAARLPTLADVDAERRRVPNWKPPSRLQYRITEDALMIVDERQFKNEVWKRDEYRCRCCGRPVMRTISRVPERGEVHHCHGRRGWLRFEANAAILVCLSCHERLTGRVNERWVIRPVERVWWFSQDSDGTKFIDARKQLKFERVA